MSFEKWTDAHQPTSAELFLDTSIHCCKHKGPIFQGRIATVLQQFRWLGTSTYAKVEYGNVVLSQAEYFLEKLEAFKSLDKLLDHVANVLPHRLHGQKVLWSFNLLVRHMSQDDADATERARCSLRRLMKLGLGFVTELCDKPPEDGTGCYWAARGIQKRRDGTLVWQTPVCRRNRKRCRLDDFFNENRDLFIKIKTAIDALPTDRRSAQLAGFSDVIAKALDDPQSLLDYRPGCKRLADAIIAVDSRAYGSVFSQNAAESELLTDILGQTFYFLPPAESKGILVKRPNANLTVAE